MVKAKLNIDIGCGENCTVGYVGMDKRALPGVDVVHDAEVFPWPFEDESVSVIIMSHFVEHVKPWLQIDLMNEAWRVLKDEGQLLISTPYGGSHRWHQDPTHCASWNETTVAYFVKTEGGDVHEVYKPKLWIAEHLFWNPRGDLEVVLKKSLSTAK